MDVDLNLDLDDIGSNDDGEGNSITEDEIDGPTSTSSHESDESDGEDLINFCRGIEENRCCDKEVDNTSVSEPICDSVKFCESRNVNNFGKAMGIYNIFGDLRGDDNNRREVGAADSIAIRSILSESNGGNSVGNGEDELPENNSVPLVETVEGENPPTENNPQPSDDENTNIEDPKKKELRMMCEAIEKRLEVGSTLQDLEQAYLIYCEYGQLKGFGVRRGEQRYLGQSTDVKWKEYVCCCTGVPDSKCSDRRLPSFKKVVMRTGCRAKIRVARKLGLPWQVTIFDREHNHALVSSEQAYMLRSSRNLTYAQTSILEALHAAGIGVSRACGFMEKESGGPQNLGFTCRDAYDHFSRKGRKSKIENGDSTMLHAYFMQKSDEDPYFYWSAEKDEEGQLMNFFFRDGRSLVDYEAFPEIVSVDTTYSTNKYNLICAPFVGVNHHTFTCMFGIGFLSDETASSFEWLFTEFLKSMKGRQPKVVFTDQCVAMMNAIDKIFPESKHRLCQWHVNRNAMKRFGSLNRNAEFKKLWRQCLNEVENEDEFDEAWKKLMGFTNPTGKSQNWFKAMHKLRHRWASVYTRGIFTAGLLSTSRSEGANRCVKAGMRRTDTLTQFVENYEEVKNSWRRRETEEDTLGIWLPGQMVSQNDLFTQAASTYTRKVYQKFERQALSAWDVTLSEEHIDLGDGDVEIRATMVTHGRDSKVVHNKNTNYAKCSCRMWESEGIFCQHILQVYQQMRNFRIPESQILKRWTKTAKSASLIRSVCSEKTGTLPTMLFVNSIVRHVYEIACTCLECEECRGFLKEKVEALGKEVFDMTGMQPLKRKRKFVSSENEDSEQTPPFSDPKRVLEKGFIHTRARRTLNSTPEKGNKKARNDPCGRDSPVAVTPDFAKKKQCGTSSGSRIPYQMNEPSSSRPPLFQQHSAGYIPLHRNYRSLSQP